MNKIIYHIDVNSAFLSWSAADQVLNKNSSLDLREECAIIGGDQESRHGIVLAKSIPTKKFNIQTGEPIVSAKRKCPNLIVEPPNYPLYVQASKAFITLLKKYCPLVMQYSIDEAWVELTGTTNLYGSPVTFAQYLKDEIYETLGFSVNIGVSSNLLLAKMGSELRKPNQVHTLFPDQISQKMWPLPVRDLFYVGSATEKKLLGLGISTIGDLANTDIRTLKAHLKKHGEVIHSFANGKSTYLNELIARQQSSNKGYGNSMTLPSDFQDLSHINEALLSLCETVGTRLRDDGVMIRTLAISITYYDFSHISHQMQLISETNITEELAKWAQKLFSDIWDRRPVRQLGVHTSKVTSTSARQYNFFDLDKHDRCQDLNLAVDSIRKRFGKNAIMRACFLNNTLHHMSGGIDDSKLTGITKPIK